jgi:hypothetical protein
MGQPCGDFSNGFCCAFCGRVLLRSWGADNGRLLVALRECESFSLMDHDAWNSVWQTDCFLAVCYRITGSASVATGIRGDQKEMEGTHTMMTPDEFTAPQPFWAEMRAYFVSNVAASVITAWSMFLFAGGLIFLVYFLSIGFMPEIDAKAFVTLLGASVLTAALLLIILISGLFAPFVLWKATRRDYEILTILWHKDGQYK